MLAKGHIQSGMAFYYVWDNILTVRLKHHYVSDILSYALDLLLNRLDSNGSPKLGRSISHWNRVNNHLTKKSNSLNLYKL
ncbi:hypothetical protein ABH968_002274 [Lysinibacillus sp. RC79]